MTPPPLTLITADPVLAEHWRMAAVGYAVQLGDELDAAGSLVLVDLAAPGLPDLADVRWRAWTATRLVIMASSLPSDLENLHALQAGARGYGHAYAPGEFWGQVLDVVAKGGAWIGPLVMQRLIQTLTHDGTHQSHDWQVKVTEREAEVAKLVANGASNKEIARVLDITERTVKSHLTILFSKLHVTDRLQLALKVKGMH